MDTLQKKENMEASSQGSHQITPSRWRIISSIGYILGFIWKWLAYILAFISKWLRSISTFIWEWQMKISFFILYRAPQKVFRSRGLQIYHLQKFYLYAKFIGISFFLIPWVILSIWYLTVHWGCGSSITRPYLNGICLRPYVNPNSGLPWLLEYWDTSADSDDTPDVLSPSMEALMIGYLDMHDAVAVLRRQASELDNLPCIHCNRLLSNLRKLLALVACLISS